jgi:Bacterial Ig-like domain (group 3)
MKSRFKSVLAGASALAIAGGMLLATSGSALALQTPGYEPDAGATLGGVDLFNAAGVQITSGNLSDGPIAAFAVAQTTPTTATPKAALFGATPASSAVTSLGTTFANTFHSEIMSSSTTYPITGTPADLAGLTNPVVTGSSSDESLATYISDLPNTDTSTTDGFGNLYQLRVKVAGVTGYAATSIQVSGTTWTQISGKFQLFADTTTTTLTPSPGSPSVPGTVETLTATVADTTSGSTNVPAGTVAFFDNTTQVGATQTLSGGTAHVTTTLALGSHPLTAVFTSSAPATVAGSTSAISTYVVAALDVTNTALSVAPTSAPAFTAVDLLATVTDTTNTTVHPTGSVSFLDGTTPIGTAPVSATTGIAEIPTYSAFAAGVHHITAVFSPTGTTLAGSTSANVDFTATAPTCPGGGTACIDPQTVVATVAAGTITITTPYSPAHPLPLGTLQLNSHGTQLSASAPFGSTIGPPSDPTGTENEIFVTDTEAGNAPWVASVQSSNFVGITPTNIINGQNAGLTGLNVITIAGNNLQAGDVATHDNPAADPAVAATAAGSLGIGGAPHPFANSAAAPGGTGGDGSVGFTGTFTLNAPTSTAADIYTATVTFTVG